MSLDTQAVSTGVLAGSGEQISLWLCPHARGEPRPTWSYRLAGHCLVCDTPLAELSPFEIKDAQPIPLPSPGELPPRPGDARLVYRGPGWIAGRWRPVEGWAAAAGYWLSVAGVGQFWVAPDGQCLGGAALAPHSGRAALVETVLGPLLVSALALRGTWCLHAGAVALAGRAVAFVGETGRGKSTLAAFLADAGGGEWSPLADDVLPLRAHAGGVVALPHFPQLKRPPQAQPAAGAPARLPLAAVYRLSPHHPRADSGPEAGSSRVEVRALAGSQAALALVRHSVAARLFAPELLARHLAFCAGAARRVPVRELAFPREPSALPRMRDALAADLARL